MKKRYAALFSIAVLAGCGGDISQKPYPPPEKIAEGCGIFYDRVSQNLPPEVLAHIDEAKRMLKAQSGIDFLQGTSGKNYPFFVGGKYDEEMDQTIDEKLRKQIEQFKQAINELY